MMTKNIALGNYEKLLETLDILSDKKLMNKIKQAEIDIRKGKIKALDKVEKELDII